MNNSIKITHMCPVCMRCISYDVQNISIKGDDIDFLDGGINEDYKNICSINSLRCRHHKLIDDYAIMSTVPSWVPDLINKLSEIFSFAEPIELPLCYTFNNSLKVGLRIAFHTKDIDMSIKFCNVIKELSSVNNSFSEINLYHECYTIDDHGNKIDVSKICVSSRSLRKFILSNTDVDNNQDNETRHFINLINSAIERCLDSDQLIIGGF